MAGSAAAVVAPTAADVCPPAVWQRLISKPWFGSAFIHSLRNRERCVLLNVSNKTARVCVARDSYL